ncbi:hypothetical protein V6Z11_D05G088800 [Gossypium hirsutum]
MKDYVKTNGHACKCTTELPFCSPNDQQSLSLMEGHPSFIECSPIFPIYLPLSFICIFFLFLYPFFNSPISCSKVISDALLLALLTLSAVSFLFLCEGYDHHHP